jgi:hypothetical protein
MGAREMLESAVAWRGTALAESDDGPSTRTYGHSKRPFGGDCSVLLQGQSRRSCHRGEAHTRLWSMISTITAILKKLVSWEPHGAFGSALTFPQTDLAWRKAPHGQPPPGASYRNVSVKPSSSNGQSGGWTHRLAVISASPISTDVLLQLRIAALHGLFSGGLRSEFGVGRMGSEVKSSRVVVRTVELLARVGHVFGLATRFFFARASNFFLRPP